MILNCIYIKEDFRDCYGVYSIQGAKRGIEVKMMDAWMEQHTPTHKKRLECWVFATPMHPKSTSSKQIKNSYFCQQTRLAKIFQCAIVVDVGG